MKQKKGIVTIASFGVALVLLVALMLGYVKLRTTDIVFTNNVEETYYVEVTKTVSEPVEKTVCSMEKVEPEVLEHQFYRKPHGLWDYVCYSSFRVLNQELNDVRYTYEYTFYVGDNVIRIDPVIKTVPAENSNTWYFETDCAGGEALEGRYSIVNAPSKEVCKQVTEMKTKTVTVQEPRIKTIEINTTVDMWSYMWNN